MPKAAAADAASPKPADTSASDPVATQPAQPPTTEATDAPTQNPTPGKVTGRWEYVSDDPLIYTVVPVTPKRGDVVAWPDQPPAADGRWKPTDAKVTRQPDNAPKEG